MRPGSADRVPPSSLERRIGWYLFALIAAGSIAAMATGDWISSSEAPTVTASASPATPVNDASKSAADQPGPESFTIAASGDIIIHESMADAAARPDGWDFSPMFSLVAPILTRADLAICHIESPLSPDNSQLSYYPVFNVPNQLADAIAQAGYDSCSLASNHSTDTGLAGIDGTISALNRSGVAHAGVARSKAERDRVKLLDANGVAVAHLSFTYGMNNGELPAEDSHLVNVIDEAAILADAQRARLAGARYVILSLHWGTEYNPNPDIFQTDLGPRLLASTSVDLILGHHAHVVQPVAAFEGEYLAYGLGNFLSNQSPVSCTGCPAGTQDGVILHLTVAAGETGRLGVTEIGHTPTWVDRSNYVIVPVLAAAGGRDAAIMAASAARTTDALQSWGFPVPAVTAGPSG